jgi:GTP-binding protein LepA
MSLKQIRNFSIIAHIDHGKSTLADRMLEITHTIEDRKMRDRVLDDMELEQEKGITIKMRPVKMQYTHIKNDSSKEEFTLNLIDTPGHIDFSYEVSRALKAVEGSVLLVDATQGVQAQTLTTLGMAREAGLTIIPAISKIDSPIARVDEVVKELTKLLDCEEKDILKVSGKTGEGVDTLLRAVIDRVPAPVEEFTGPNDMRALVFDFQYSNHKGVIVFVRILDGKVMKGDELRFTVAGEKFVALEVGVFKPEETATGILETGQIGYIVTGIKKPGVASVGDTVTQNKYPMPAMPGYSRPSPVVWASMYPESQDDFDDLRLALGRLRLSDSSFTHEEETSGSLGRGFRCGFLGLLHLEIITERLKREFNLDLIVATPSITYEVTYRTGTATKAGTTETIYSPSLFPEYGTTSNIREPWMTVNLFAPSDYLGALVPLLYEHEAEVEATETLSDGRASMTVHMPLRELMRNFFDELKSVSSGYASISYEFEGMRDADVARLDILVADEPVEAFSKVVSVRRIEEEAEKSVEKLHSILPRQMFTTKIQGRGLGRIISSRTLSAMQKDVTQHMYGGDITRKMKLREKQKKGKKKMLERGRGNVNIPNDVFLKMMRTGE